MENMHNVLVVEIVVNVVRLIVKLENLVRSNRIVLRKNIVIKNGKGGGNTKTGLVFEGKLI